MSIPSMARYPVPASLRRTPTDNYAQRTKPTGGTYARGKHGGSDIKPSVPGKVGESVYPAWNGRVAFAVDRRGGWGVSYGKQVLVEHSHKHKDGTAHRWYTFYAHLDSIRCKAGERVTIDRRIGTLGKSGDVSGPHVHFELHTRASWQQGLVNPYDRLNKRRCFELKKRASARAGEPAATPLAAGPAVPVYGDTATRWLLVALGFMGGLALLGIVALAAIGREVPDVLENVALASLTAAAGILAPSPALRRHDHLDEDELEEQPDPEDGEPKDDAGKGKDEPGEDAPAPSSRSHE